MGGRLGLKEFKGEVIKEYENGASLYMIAERYGFSESTVKENLKLWGINVSDKEITVIKKAKTVKHRNEKVVIDGKEYRDITDYIIDCGTGE